jgi:hypothetical protein
MFGNSTAAGYGAVPVRDALPAARAQFVRRTYEHLAGAVLVFVVLEFL